MGGGGFQKVKSISAKWTKPLITITVPVNDVAWNVMILMRANHFESHWTFLGPNDTHFTRCHFRPKKVSIFEANLFQWPPSKLLSPSAKLKNRYIGNFMYNL
jgi:hypothetical protein